MQDENQAEAAPAVLTMTIEVKRKDTGIVETYQLIGTPVAEPELKEGA